MTGVQTCALPIFMPAGLGESMLRSPGMRRFLDLFTGGKRLATTSLTVFLLLRLLASLRRFRRGMLGYRHEQQAMARWLRAVESAADTDQALALADSGGLVKGYGETRYRTSAQLAAILAQVEARPDLSAAAISALRQAALADDENVAFDRELAGLV